MQRDPGENQGHLQTPPNVTSHVTDIGREVGGPYGQAARGYLADGYSPLPLPARKKATPPEGWTGRNAPMASGADVEEWCAANPGGNICLRLPEGVVGIDVDAHRSEAARRSWEQLTETLGPLPEAPWSSSRDDGTSGIRLFRVPDGYEAAGDLPGDPSPGETIRHGHRYMVVAPSVVAPPLGNGEPYRWITPLVPVSELPFLPLGWQKALSLNGHSDWTHPDVDKLVAHGAVDGSHTQREQLRDLVFELARRGMSDEAIGAVFWAVVAKTPQLDPSWPWLKGDLDHLLSGARRRLAKDDGGRVDAPVNAPEPVDWSDVENAAPADPAVQCSASPRPRPPRMSARLACGPCPTYPGQSHDPRCGGTARRGRCGRGQPSRR
jgi:hypothetical protein